MLLLSRLGRGMFLECNLSGTLFFIVIAKTDTVVSLHVQYLEYAFTVVFSDMKINQCTYLQRDNSLKRIVERNIKCHLKNCIV